MKLGNLYIQNNVFLAPMAGITDMPFRILCKEFGCGLVFTEMVSAKGLYYNDKKTESLIYSKHYEKPVGVQIFGSDPYIMAKSAEKLNTFGVELLDINLGCPTPKITANGDGCAVVKDLYKTGEIIKEVVKVFNGPVGVKIRKGWDENSVNAVEVAKIAEQNGVSMITVHGRTRVQFYSGLADWDIIKQVKENVKIPVIGNGDIVSKESAEKIIKDTKCDGIMIGRAARGNPWIFNEILSKKICKVLIEDKIDIIKRHLKIMVEYYGEDSGVKRMRKHIGWYLKGEDNSAKIKDKVFKMHKECEIVSILDEYVLGISKK